MKVLGIDPGTKNVGYALLEDSKAGIKHLSSGTIFLGDGEVLERLLLLQKKLSELVLNLNPDQIAFESLIYVKSPSTLIKLAMAKGVMLGVVADKYQNNIFEYKPNLVKQVVTGHGHADKESSQKMIKTILKIDNFSSFDESDAISIALCHLLMHSKKMLLAPGPKKKSKNQGSLAASVAHRVLDL